MSTRLRTRDSAAWRRTVGSTLRRIRRERGLSQAILAKRAGVSVTYVSLIERGHANPRLQTLSALARALETSPVELLMVRPPSTTPTLA